MENKLLKELIVLQRIDSTNNYAMEQLHAGMANHGTAWLAMEQTAGRGQRGRQWTAEPGANILLSIIIEPSRANLSAPFELSVCFALAAQTLFNKYSIDSTTVKWPNDIYWRDRKAGGILIENVFRGTSWDYAIAGIGLNIN
ncbi:MAG TPA: biotin--[acetyl-CoA-carboxylase] ligase, partial [Parasegetibacter sp.]